jgi:nucleoid-associated protein YgaU
MKFILQDVKTGVEMVLPVTPASFEVPHGIHVETVNITELGDIALGGFYKLDNIKLDFMLPAHDYPFLQPGASTDPYSYIRQLMVWCDTRSVVRFIISGTIANCTALIEDYSYSERDASGDVYVTMSLHKYRYVEAVRTQSNSTGNAARSTAGSGTAAAAAKPNSYTVVYGDTLSAITRRFYGSSSLYPKLAKYNGIKNANIIHVGQVIKLPDKAALG